MQSGNQLLNGLNGVDLSGTAAGHNALFHSGAGGVQSVLNPQLLLLHGDLGLSTDLDDGHAAAELSQALLELLAVVVGGGGGNGGADHVGTLLDGLGSAVAIDDGGGVLGHDHLTAVAQVIHGGIGQLHVQGAGDHGTAGQHGDILQHLLAAVAEAGGLNADHIEAALQAVQQQSGQSVAFHILGDDDELPAGLDNGLQNRQDLLNVGDLLIGDQQVSIVQDGFHLVGIGDHVGGDIAPVELHAFHHVQAGLGGLALFDGDDALGADLFHGLGNQLADGSVAGGDGANTGDVLGAVNRHGIGLDGLHSGGNGLLNALAHDHGVCTGGQVLQALAGDGLGQQSRGGGAVTGHIIGLGSDLADELCAHILKGILQLDLLGDGHAIVGDQGSAVLLAQNHIAALRSQSYLNGIGQLVNAGLQLLASFLAINDHLCHNALPPQSVTTARMSSCLTNL